ncbi:hypothetical protein [Borreliella americana]|uniref:hypothetical protein n=1 Tax=Borreliella americana TaxID=478807 RepID=UPI001E56349F|nr:hypothetical protein [Borreliella americana]MCD2382101.1 hypothetical protein [Borreliella americana]
MFFVSFLKEIQSVSVYFFNAKNLASSIFKEFLENFLRYSKSLDLNLSKLIIKTGPLFRILVLSKSA